MEVEESQITLSKKKIEEHESQIIYYPTKETEEQESKITVSNTKTKESGIASNNFQPNGGSGI